MFEQEVLLEQLGDKKTNHVVERLNRFASVPNAVMQGLAEAALSEEWGQNLYVLKKYLAVYIAWSIEQERYTTSQDQFYVTAGHLQTRYGTPLYLVFTRNSFGNPPWLLLKAAANISAPELPAPPDIPVPPELVPGTEIVMAHDHILGNNLNRVAFLENTPHVAQICAVSGAIQWSLYRGLQIPYWYFGQMHYLIPLYLQSRENIALAPDVIAPVQVSSKSLMVRTVLEPSMPYANARVAVPRHDQLPHWLLDSWSTFANQATEQEIDDPEFNT